MTADDLVRRLIKCSIQRAVQESLACLVIVAGFGFVLQQTQAGTPRHYGCLLILVSAGFIAGVVWSFALSYSLLRTHPASDASFWREAFHAQARLLRLVPLWYLAPLLTGFLLFSAPMRDGEVAPFLVAVSVAVLVFGGLTWLNRRGAAQLEVAAACLGS